jgi:hypothetical protein
MSGEDPQPGDAKPSGDSVEPETVVRDPEAAERKRRARATAAAEAARKRRGEDTLDPRRPPANATIYRESRRHSGLEFDDPGPAPSGRALWQRLLAVLALLVVIGVGVVLIVLGGSSGQHRARHRKTVAAAKAKHPAKPTTHARTWPVYTTSAYTASYPPGWKVAENNAPVSGGAYFETRFVSPSGGTLIDIDRTPADPDSAQQAAKSVAAASSSEAGYQQLAFTALTLAGAPAWKWAFLAPAAGRITLAGYHDDLFRHIDGGRYATLGVGGSRGATARLTERVAASITTH